MGGATDRKHDDDVSSIASFEDVGAPTSSASKTSPIKDLVLRTAGDKPVEEVISDVLYVVEYRDVHGHIVNRCKSDKPIDPAKEDVEEKDLDKKPVIEVLTKVSARLKGSSRRERRRLRARSEYSDDGYSSASSDSDSDSRRRREMNVSNVEKTEMIIHSEHLKNALNAVINYYPAADLSGDRMVIPAPYHVLLHHRDALNQYKMSQPSCHDLEYKETTIKHIDVLLGFLNRTFGEKLRDEERRQLNNTPAATFEWFWLLLKPGEVVYAKKNNEWMPFVVSEVEEYSSSNRMVDYDIFAWNISFARGRLRRNMESFTVKSFVGEQAIHSLGVIPAKFFPEDLEKQGGMKMAERQVQLGKMYWELCKRPSYKDYDGPLIEKDQDSLGHYAGRVIVDPEGYDRYGQTSPDQWRNHHRGRPMPIGQRPLHVLDQLPVFNGQCTCRACGKETREETGPFANFEDVDPNESEAPKNDLYYIALSTNIPAFLLGDRRWGRINVDLLKDVKSDREAFKYLVLEDEIKLTVKALIGKFASEDGKVSAWPRDLVKNKGEGRIFLLHGSPGVGKTCTAECVAELTHRPLMALTSGDISTSMNASSVERSLNYFMTLAERYGALLLLDEADVYLEERRTKDLHRNGLVSIFLRALEYYRGVLFLTTNRVEAFDSAFTSRIHVALHYKRLGDEDRARIWNNNFERLERDSGGKVYISRSTHEYVDESEDVRSLRWNGREIRNALQTAVALAETEALEDGCDKVSVTEKHLQAVVKMSKGFKDFLRRRKGWEDESDSDEDDSSSEMSSLLDD